MFATLLSAGYLTPGRVKPVPTTPKYVCMFVGVSGENGITWLAKQVPALEVFVCLCVDFLLRLCNVEMINKWAGRLDGTEIKYIYKETKIITK